MALLMTCPWPIVHGGGLVGKRPGALGIKVLRLDFVLGWWSTMRPNTITKIIQKQFFCVTDVRAIRKLVPRELWCVIGAFTEVPYGGARITQDNSCHKALYNRSPVQL